MMKLHTMPHPDRDKVQVQVFRTWQLAFGHLKDHLLTAPECHAWALVTPEYAGLVDPDDGDQCYRFSKDAVESEGETAQPLYDVYCAAIRHAAEVASRLQWLHTKQDLTVGFGNHGVYFLMDLKVIKTAYLPGFGTVEATRAGQQVKELSPHLARDRGGGKMRHKRQVASAKRHEQKWNANQMLFYRVFRPCWNWLKSRQPDPDKDDLAQAHLWLKDKLPKRGQFSYDDWQETL